MFREDEDDADDDEEDDEEENALVKRAAPLHSVPRPYPNDRMKGLAPQNPKSSPSGANMRPVLKCPKCGQLDGPKVKAQGHTKRDLVQASKEAMRNPAAQPECQHTAILTDDEDIFRQRDNGVVYFSKSKNVGS